MFKLSKSRFSTVASDGSSRMSSIQSMDLKRDSTEPKCRELQTQILNMWRRIWLGLYQLHDNHGPYHVERLTQLYLGAGMAVSDMINKPEDLYGRYKTEKAPLGLLGCALASQGISRLRKHEVAALNEVYELLRSLQVGLRETTDHDEKAVREHYPPLADPLARRLIHPKRLEIRLRGMGG